MTIARRLMVMLAVPLVALLGLGVFSGVRMVWIEREARLMVESEVVALAAVGNLARSFAELGVHVRSYLLAADNEGRSAARTAFAAGEREVARLLELQGGRERSSAQERELATQYGELAREWIGEARQVISLVNVGQDAQAVGLLQGKMGETAERVSKVAQEWIRQTEGRARAVGQEAVEAIDRSRRAMLLGNGGALLVTGFLGLVMYRRVVGPLRGLVSSVEAIGAGEYGRAVPFTEAADEVGGLARAVDMLKRVASAREELRWIKANVATLSAQLQGASSLSEFGQRLLAGLVPMLGGGVGAFYLPDPDTGRLKRRAIYGLAPGIEQDTTFGLGEGLVGQCAADRKPAKLTDLPPAYLAIESGLGAGAPAQVVAWPLLLQEELLGVVEVATFRPWGSRETALLEEVLPQVAMGLELLERHWRTQELLERTRDQARQIKEQTEALTRLQEHLVSPMDDWLAQQEELAVQREKAEAGEGRLGLILELSREGLMGTDSEGRITFINDAACRALGYTAGELVGQIIHEAIHHSRSDARVYPVGACPLCHAWQRGEKIRIEDAMLWRKDGRGFPAAYTAAPLLREDRVAGSVVRFIEISERKQQGTEFAGPTTDSHGNADTASASTTARVGVSRRGLPTDGLPVIEGLETLDGLGRVAGNRRLYLRMLRQFVEQQEEAPARIAEALKRNEPVVAERLVGAVKGTAGSLGATGVERAAEALEKAIADEGDAAKRATCWREFQSIHEDFVRRLRAALAGLEPRDPP